MGRINSDKGIRLTGRWTLLLCLLFGMSGCAVVPMLAAIPSAVVEPIFGQFGSQVRSVPASMRRTLVATQRSLLEMKLSVDVLEIEEKGYNISFGNETLDGEIELRSQTEKLTTIDIQVRTKTRRESVEKAVLDQIEQTVEHVNRRDHFNFRAYKYLRIKPDLQAKQVGWYLPGAQLEVKKVYNKPEWLSLKMPSGKHAYLKGSIAQGS